MTLRFIAHLFTLQNVLSAIIIVNLLNVKSRPQRVSMFATFLSLERDFK